MLQITDGYVNNVRYQPVAVEMLRSVAEDYMHSMFQKLRRYARHDRKRVTVLPKDFKLWRKLQ